MLDGVLSIIVLLMLEFRLFERFAYFVQKSDVKIGTGKVQPFCLHRPNEVNICLYSVLVNITLSLCLIKHQTMKACDRGRGFSNFNLY